MTAPLALVVGAGTAAGGTALLVSARRLRHRQVTLDVTGYLREAVGDAVATDEFEQRLSQPLSSRLLGPLVQRARTAGARWLPAGRIATFDRQIALAGLEGTTTGEEQAATQLVLTIGSFLLGIAWTALAQPAAGMAICLLALLPVCGALAVPTRLARRIRERQDAIRRDLPDVLDLLAISVEAGLGFEAAMEVAVGHFEGPLADELARTVRETGLGRSRREALGGLRDRTDVAELTAFVVALTQADALGIPIGRVLHTQAGELRARRRQWAREKAAKLPVKILFPMVGLIFPSIFVVLLGPAAVSIFHALH